MPDPFRDRIEELFHLAADLAPLDREAFLDAECQGDPELRAAVARLLEFDDGDGDDFLRGPGTEARAVLTGSPERIGRYRILGTLGEGGMGRVYEAEQESPRRTVALKVIRPEFCSPEMVRRFAREVELLGRLRHPGIAQVYEAGGAEHGQPFFAMELVRGLSLGEYARNHKLDTAARLELLAKICDAVQYAHEQGIIHRDLKPANILVDETGQPKVLDFGVARSTDADAHGPTLQTQAGQVLGTLAYMSPEQLTGDPRAIDRRTDVYALGVILFELLAERLPYDLQRLPLPEAARVIQEGEPLRVGAVNARFRGDLETVVGKALEKERHRRYPAAGELASDIRRFLRDEPVTARPPSLIYQLRKFARRNRALVGGVTAVVLALSVGLVATGVQTIREAEQRKRAEAATQTALRQAYWGNLAGALAAVEAHDVAEAARHLEAAPEELRGWEWRHLHGRLDDSLSVLRGLETQSDAVAFCPAPDCVVSAEAEGVRLWKDGKFAGMLTTDNTHRIRIAPIRDRTLLFIQDRAETGWREFTAPLEPGAAGRPVSILEGRQIDSLAVSPDGKRVALTWTTGKENLSFFTMTLDRGAERVAYHGHTGGLFMMSFAPDGERIVSAAEDGTARVWDVATGETLVVLRGHTDKVCSARFHPDGVRLVTGSDDGTVRQWDSRTGKLLQTRRGHTGGVHHAHYSPDGQWIASAGLDRTIRLWKTDAPGEEPFVLVGHTGPIARLAFSPDGRLLTSTAQDGTARVWRLASWDDTCTLRGHTSYVYPVACRPDGTRIASGGWDKTIRVWDAKTGKELLSLPHDGFVFSLGWSPDGGSLVSGDHGGTIRVWELSTRKTKLSWQGHPAAVSAAAFSPDGKGIASAGWDQQVCLWDAGAGELICRLTGHEGRVHGLAFHPDGRRLATVGDDRMVRLWDLDAQRQTAVLEGHTAAVFAVAFDRAGKRLASASLDRTVRVWDADSGTCLAELRGHADEVLAVAFHPDGNRVASGGRDRTVRLWDVAAGRDLVRLRGHTDYIYSLAFTPDGRTLVSGSGDSTLRLWDSFPAAERAGP